MFYIDGYMKKKVLGAFCIFYAIIVANLYVSTADEAGKPLLKSDILLLEEKDNKTIDVGNEDIKDNKDKIVDIPNNDSSGKSFKQNDVVNGTVKVKPMPNDSIDIEKSNFSQKYDHRVSGNDASAIASIRERFNKNRQGKARKVNIDFQFHALFGTYFVDNPAGKYLFQPIHEGICSSRRNYMYNTRICKQRGTAISYGGNINIAFRMPAGNNNHIFFGLGFLKDHLSSYSELSPFDIYGRFGLKHIMNSAIAVETYFNLGAYVIKNGKQSGGQSVVEKLAVGGLVAGIGVDMTVFKIFVIGMQLRYNMFANSSFNDALSRYGYTTNAYMKGEYSHNVGIFVKFGLKFDTAILF